MPSTCAPPTSLEPYEHHYRVRFASTASCAKSLAADRHQGQAGPRIKVISRLDISEKRVPQDGRMKLKVGPDRVIDFRVSTCPRCSARRS
jgi:type IV pilus assembly protein PilB